MDEIRVGEFAFTVELRDGTLPACSAAEDRWYPLAAALSSVPVELLARLVEARTGYAKEETTGFCYSEDDPGAVPAGKVRVFFQDDVLLLERSFFDAAAAAYGLAALELLRGAGLPAPAETREKLRAVRTRE